MDPSALGFKAVPGGDAAGGVGLELLEQHVRALKPVLHHGALDLAFEGQVGRFFLFPAPAFLVFLHTPGQLVIKHRYKEIDVEEHLANTS